MQHRSVARLFFTLASVAAFALGASQATALEGALPTEVPGGTALVVADQNEELQTLMIASGEHAKLLADVTYANFLGGPAILEAFRAGALDLATVGNAPPIQAQAAGETIPIVAARQSSDPDYFLAVRPGLTVSTLERAARQAHHLRGGHGPPALRAECAEARRPDEGRRRADPAARGRLSRCDPQRAGRRRRAQRAALFALPRGLRGSRRERAAELGARKAAARSLLSLRQRRGAGRPGQGRRHPRFRRALDRGEQLEEGESRAPGSTPITCSGRT